jgi:hypothetical protein
MTVMTCTRTTIGQLIYSNLPKLDFAKLVADLEVALAGCEAGTRHPSFHGDRMAMIDAGASRVTVSLADGLDRRGAAAVIVTVGYAPLLDGDQRLARRRTVLSRLIVERVASRFAPSETVWTESEEEATPEMIGQLIEGLAARREAQEASRSERARARRSLPRHFVEPDDLPRMMARFDASLAARRTGRPAAVAAAEGSRAALDITDLALLEGAKERANASGRTSSAPMRLAAHLIDATLMVVALPVGAGMMVYSLSRGANLNTSARALAISGLGIGVVHKLGSGGILASMLWGSI